MEHAADPARGVRRSARGACGATSSRRSRLRRSRLPCSFRSSFVSPTLLPLRPARDDGLAVRAPAVLASAATGARRATHRAGSSTPNSRADPPPQRCARRRRAPSRRARGGRCFSPRSTFRSREDATVFAVDSAVETGQPLVVVNVAEVLPTRWTPRRVRLRRERADLQDALRKPAELAHSLAVNVERLRVCSPHPVDALLEVVAERNPGVLVFGPDRSRLRRRTYERAVKRIRERVELPRLDCRPTELGPARVRRLVRNTIGEEAIDVRFRSRPRTSSSAPASTGSRRPTTSRRSCERAVPARAPTSSSSTSRSPAQAHPASPAASSATTTSSRR